MVRLFKISEMKCYKLYLQLAVTVLCYVGVVSLFAIYEVNKV